jgi:hypothetical protein
VKPRTDVRGGTALNQETGGRCWLRARVMRARLSDDCMCVLVCVLCLRVRVCAVCGLCLRTSTVHAEGGVVVVLGCERQQQRGVYTDTVCTSTCVCAACVCVRVWARERLRWLAACHVAWHGHALLSPECVLRVVRVCVLPNCWLPSATVCAALARLCLASRLRRRGRDVSAPRIAWWWWWRRRWWWRDARPGCVCLLQHRFLRNRHARRHHGT